jgi:hypothetical protein
MRKSPHDRALPSREESRKRKDDLRSEEKIMFLYADAQSRLDLGNQRINDMLRQADAYRLARAASGGRHRRFGGWLRRHREAMPAQVSVTA